MPSKTRSVFRTAALLSGIVTQEQLDCAEALLRQQQLDDSSDTLLADKLVDMGVVTRYQADQMLTGRNKLHLGPYLITDYIGQGGMGQVFKGVHSLMGRECALKVLPIIKLTDEAINNFMREIRTHARLDHPNIVRAYDAGVDGKVRYLVTEYVPGMDLRRLIRSQGPLSMQQAAGIIVQAARGLHHAHECGLIHRDMKPGNILVTPEGVAKVSDLGLAGFCGEGDADPRLGKIVGTADYLSPEQIRNPHEINRVSDIYSLGCTLYYAVTGKVPFPGGTPHSKAQRHLAETPFHPKRFCPDIAEEFVEIIADMMEKEPARRIQTAAEVATRLEPWATEVGVVSDRHLSKSPWTPPPLPMDSDEAVREADTSRIEFLDESESSRSQWSQNTDPVLAATQETKQMPTARPLPPPLPAAPLRRGLTRFSVSTLVAAMVFSLAVGIALGFSLREWWLP